VKLAFGVGGSLDVIAGKVKQTPAIWKKWNVEWLHRLLTAKAAKGQKSRWKRQLSTMPQFILKAIIQNK
jgi:N-acetylglucosaminyldiphosphoundecaprenol N-acetyl-beta-D-mannosaminyltransferase